MKITRTDRAESLVAQEFLWDTDVETEVHGYVWPELERRLRGIKAESLLDIGSGNGVLTQKLSAVVPKCVGIDFSQSGVEIARSRFPRIRFECASISEALPVSFREQFDIVTATEVIEHLFLPRQLFTRAKEALRPGGYFLLTTPYHGYLKNLALALAGKYDSHWHPLRDHGHVKFFSEETLRTLFAEQGFEVDYFARVGRIPPLARSMLMGARLSGG